MVACGWRLGERESDVPPGVRLNVPFDVPLVAQLDVEKAPQQAVVEHFADGPLEPDGQRYALTLLRTLAEGEPVSAAMLAARTGQLPADAAAFIDRLPGIYRDDGGRVIGMWALAVPEFPPHRHRIDGRQLFTWCAWDPFILTDWLGGTAEVSSVDAHTEEPVGFRLEDGSRGGPVASWVVLSVQADRRVD